MVMPKKPQWLHDLSGTRSQVAVNEDEALPSSRPQYPKNISAAAKKTFKKLCALLEARRALTAGDCELLRLYSLIFDRHERALAKLTEEGEIRKYSRLDAHGEPCETEKLNYWYRVSQDCEKSLVSILDRTGLTPMTRSKIKPTAPPEPKEGQEVYEEGTVGWYEAQKRKVNLLEANHE
jgi:P27 family predicted phage terminase small subunit